LKPGKGDIPVHVKISGLQLTELQRHTGDMCEAYGLDSKIERYKGTKPISFYRWDLDCVLDVLDMALGDRTRYPSQDCSEYEALSSLRASLKQAYKQTFQD
jgi:hypothetical protein